MKVKLFQKALNWVENKGFENIKANTEEFETPHAFVQPNKDKELIPDITGTLRGNKFYIEVVTKEESKNDLVTKWKLLCAIAARKGGKLYLLAGRGYKSFADNIIKNYNLQNVILVSI